MSFDNLLRCGLTSNPLCEKIRSAGAEVARALQGIENLPCPALTGQGKIRLQKLLQGRLQGKKVITCQPVTSFIIIVDIFYKDI